MDGEVLKQRSGNTDDHPMATLPRKRLSQSGPTDLLQSLPFLFFVHLASLEKYVCI